MIQSIKVQSVWLKGGLTIMARVEGNGAVAITQSSLTSVAGLCTNLATGSSVALTVSKTANVFDTLQNDAYWTDDEIGYNFRVLVPGSALPATGNYQVDIEFTPADSSGPFVVPFEIPVKRTFI